MATGRKSSEELKGDAVALTGPSDPTVPRGCEGHRDRYITSRSAPTDAGADVRANVPGYIHRFHEPGSSAGGFPPRGQGC